MTKFLQQTFEAAAKLSADEQDVLASRLLAEHRAGQTELAKIME